MTPLPETNAVSRELGRLALRLGLLEGGAPEWAALVRVCEVSPAALFAVMAREGQVDEETLFPLLDGILVVTYQLRPRGAPASSAPSAAAIHPPAIDHRERAAVDHKP